ncbi:MAG: DUF1223 domain-containing protein [Usitatibacter sp.]
MRFALLFTVMLPALSSAAECTARSGPTSAALVELYTSEGCSSCPPADRWLSKLGAAANVVPLAFHVTYWDYIGWRDAYADERHTARQRERANASGSRYVYTPQVVVGGRDFREWNSGSSFEKAVERINRTPSRVDVELRLQPAEDGKLTVTANAALKPGVAAKDLALVIVATQNGLSSRVTAGENRGEQLRHDFVVRDFLESRAFTLSGTATASRIFPIRDGKPGSVAVAAFVQNLKTGEVLQALSAPMCAS